MSVPVRGAVLEAQSLLSALREERDREPVGPVVVSGMLAEQLARELGAGAEPGAVIAGDAARVADAAAVVHVIAGEASASDDELLRRADRHGVPVVLVQLWPQAEWKRSFVLTPFVVECQAGNGFPVQEISRRLVEGVEHPTDVARRVPVLQEAVTQAVVGASAIRAAIVGALGRGSRGARPVLVLEQIRLLAELRALRGSARQSDPMPALAGIAAATVAAGFLFRGAARRAQRTLPAPVVNAVVAAAGTWALGTAFRRLDERLG